MRKAPRPSKYELISDPVDAGASQADRYTRVVLERLAGRFSSEAAARNWLENGRIPSYGEKTPLQMIAQGSGTEVIAAIAAIESGVHA